MILPIRPALDDYDYDANGNLISDKNKGIASITYNHLNLPLTVTINGKGTIAYTYDASGNKLKKVITDISTAGKTITIITTYIGDMIYESKTTVPSNTPSDDYTDRLQFIAHEEGRIRLETATTSTSTPSPDRFEFDYFLKDHLGNVRMVLTDEQSQDAYPAASLEEATLDSEKIYYRIPEGGSRVNRNNVPGYPQNDGYTSPNDYVQRLKGSAQKIGTSIVLKSDVGR